MKTTSNFYIPTEATITDVREIAKDIRLFTFSSRRKIFHKPGQFLMVSVFGYGEVPISITSTHREPLMLCIKKVGFVTSGIHMLKAGDKVGLRGPYGNEFPFDIAKGRDVVILAGGLGVVPLRPVIHEMMENRKDYGNVHLLYGCRPSEMLYNEEIEAWEKAGIEIIYGLRGKKLETPDACVRAPHNVSKVTSDLTKAIAYVCGPQTMIELSMKELEERGMPPENIVTSLEAHMKCGVGKCGHCYMGARYICTDGPVFTKAQLDEIGMD